VTPPPNKEIIKKHSYLELFEQKFFGLRMEVDVQRNLGTKGKKKGPSGG
jgi:hypothetical protein